MRARSNNPFARSAAAGSRLISEPEFAAVYAGADFAYEFQLYFNTTVTLSWSLLGDETSAAVQRRLNSWLKCLRDWFDQRRLPQAWIYSHEVGRRVGLHTHFAIAIPGSLPGYPPIRLRDEFRAWAAGWPARQIGRRAPRALRVRGPAIETPWLHWLVTHYLLKGYDPDEVVQSARLSPDGLPVRLGDLIAFGWRDPGQVLLRDRVKVSGSLGPSRRMMGVPAGVEVGAKCPIVDPLRLTFEPPHEPAGREVKVRAFRSKYEDGARDVRILYPQEFLERFIVDGVARAVRGPLDEEQMVDLLEV